MLHNPLLMTLQISEFQSVFVKSHCCILLRFYHLQTYMTVSQANKNLLALELFGLGQINYVN